LRPHRHTWCIQRAGSHHRLPAQKRHLPLIMLVFHNILDYLSAITILFRIFAKHNCCCYAKRRYKPKTV
jgi:hypothetical protein